MNINKIRKLFTMTNILIAVATSIIGSLAFDYYINWSGRNKVFAEISENKVSIPALLSNTITNSMNSKIDLLVIKLNNQSNRDVNLHFIERQFIKKFVGISSDIDILRYSDNVYNASLLDFDKPNNKIIFKGLKSIPAENVITIYLWGEMLEMPGALKIESEMGDMPIFNINSYGSMSFARLYIAKHIGLISFLVGLVYLYLIMIFRGKE